MARLVMSYETHEDPDGVEGTVEIVREDVLTVEDMLKAFEQFMRAAGYTYVETIHAETTNGGSFSSGW